MAFGLFKKGNEIYGDGVDLVKRKEYEKAIRTFQKAIEKDADNDGLAQIMIAVLNISSNPDNHDAYVRAADVLMSKGNLDFDFGLTTFNTTKLATECTITANAISARMIDGSKNDVAIQKGNALIQTAQEAQIKIGNEPLQLYELYRNIAMTGLKFALTLMAEGNESLATGYLWTDPKKAAEYQQIAYNYRRQIGDSGDDNQKKILSYSKSATCWICGRDATGEGMHFYAMSSDISPQLKKDDGNPLPSATDDFESIYVCRACYTAISRRSDAIAKHYHEISMAEMNRMESRLQAEIAALHSEVNSLRMMSR